VLKDEKVEHEVSELLDQYINDLAELIGAKLSKIKEKYEVPENEVKRIKELVEELRHAHEMKCKE
jgi:non-homologous end joining protein Ku